MWMIETCILVWHQVRAAVDGMLVAGGRRHHVGAALPGLARGRGGLVGVAVLAAVRLRGFPREELVQVIGSLR